MSLWLASLGECLHNYQDNPEKKAQYILSYLSMDVPREEELNGTSIRK
jgi:hypothetical protein